MNEYTGVFIAFICAGLIAGGLLLTYSFLGKRKYSSTNKEPFESGEIPFSLPKGRFAVKFYVLAFLFLIFDVELVFLFPWAVVLKQLGVFGLIEMLVFLIFIIAGFIYALKKKALEWN